MKPLKPVMAALLAASSAAFALRGIAYATPPACPSGDAEKNPVNELACLIAQKPEARKDIGERLARFLAGKDASGRQYVTPGLLGDANALPGVLAIAKDWPEKNKANPGMIAVLYFVMGPDNAVLPAWAQTPLLTKTFRPNMSWSARLAKALERWTDKDQIAQSGAAEATAAFLNDAAEQARVIFDDPRTKKDLQLSVDVNDVTGATSPTTAPSARLETTGSGFGFDALYRDGAKVGNVYSPIDNGYRTLSMKVYTMDDGSGHLINKIGIVDITPGDGQTPSVPQFVDSSHPGDSKIKIRNGGREYIVTVGSDGSVTLKRPGGKDGDGNGSIGTSKTELTALRDAQIARAGKVTIGGQSYYVLGQGGAKGSFLFFSQAQMDAAPNGNAHPELMGEVAEVIGDGSTAGIKGHPDLGQLQDGTHWHLEFDAQTRLWKVVTGAGDKKEEKKPGGAPDKPGDGTPLLAELLKLPAHEGWTEGDGNDTISDDMKDQFKVMKDKKGLAYVVSPAFAAPNYELHLVGDPDMRAFKKYVVVVTKAGDVSYYDLPALVALSKGDKDGATPSGQFLKKSNEMRDAKDIVVAADILHTYMSKEIDLKPGVDKYGSSGSYAISAGSPSGRFAVRIDNEKQDCEIWPSLGASCKDVGSGPAAAPGTPPEQAADAVSPPKAYEGCIDKITEGNVDRILYKDPGATKMPVGVPSKDNDACLYEYMDSNNRPQYLMTINFKTKDEPEQRKAYLFTGDLKKPAQFTYKTLGSEVVENATPQTGIGLVQGSDSAHGVYGFFLSGDQSQLDGPASGLKNKAENCKGAVVWWGMDEAAALKACQAGLIGSPHHWWQDITMPDF